MRLTHLPGRVSRARLAPWRRKRLHRPTPLPNVVPTRTWSSYLDRLRWLFGRP
jgi:hypothetical protein